MGKPRSASDSLGDKREQIRKLLVERHALREEYAYWADVYAANYDLVAHDIMQMVTLEGERINEKIGVITQSILMLWAEFHSSYDAGDLPN
jgi:hypothetical protein